MCSLRITLCVGAVLAAAFTPTAHAADAGVPVTSTSAADAGVRVTPASPAPGSDIQLRATGCAGQTGTAKSAAFVADAQLTGRDGTLTGESRVPTSLQPGTYDIKVSCDGYDKRIKGSVTVTVASSGRVSPSTAPASPVAPVHAGGGGAATQLAMVDARQTGPGTWHAVIGLVLASVAAVAVAVRSARRSRRGGARD
ncbi:hypothetical protein ACFYPC_14100 [Streptomyces sp. NPDC005808]|uniref:hypothetical protein n=1 Tax=Streptomyces sp. NPDC005808 TaxID=3364734 RepID=UPI0036CE08AD